jgi:DNA-binding response OmpR family regulator
MEKNEIWRKKKVCIIDDDANIREIYLMKFNLEGFDVSVATNGEEGMRVIRETMPDIILLDIEMPVMNGMDVLEQLHADTALVTIPVIMLTNQDNEEAFRQVGKYHTRFYIIKSLATPQKVVDLVREALR